MVITMLLLREKGRFWKKEDSHQTRKIPSVLNHGCVLDSAVCNLIGCTGAAKEEPEL